MLQVSHLTTNYTQKEVEKKEPESPSLEEFPPELLVKHPLQHTWTIWYYEMDKSKNWDQCQREISSFDTAEDFWSLYNHIKQASELKIGCDYSMFKQGITPMWEDNANKNGGRWILNLDKKNKMIELDKCWLEILLCMIGEGFNAHSDEICGAVVNVRNKCYKIALWTSNADSESSVMEIGWKLKERLRIPSVTSVVYQVHSDAKSKNSSTTKHAYKC